jgi:two-component system, NtrC family, response regulator HydG
MGKEEELLGEAIGRRLLVHTPSLLPSLQRIALVASCDAIVLLTGETGTGKTHLARLIHACSPRRDRSFMAVSCGSLSPYLVESEFFGHVPGAFTGAYQTKIGKFAAAGDGTLLLDEIDALGLHQQANLIRVLETGEFEPVGSNQTQLCRARIVAASNWELESAVAEGRFRHDLYYRLNVMPFHLPPLRERVQDIGPLARIILARFGLKLGKELRSLSAEALAALELFPWPGNIRQLENAVQQAAIVARGPELRLCDLPQVVQRAVSAKNGEGLSSANMLQSCGAAAEQRIIEQAPVKCDHSKSRAATSLGISPNRLDRKMKKYGLRERTRRP